MVATGPRVALAFGLNLAAGLSTCIGGIIILNKKLVNLASPSSVGIAFGLAAGVMVFISLTEIFEESVNEFQKSFGGKNQTEFDKKCNDKCKGNSKLFAILCFIIGGAIIYLLDFIIHKIAPNSHHELNVYELNSLHQPESNHQPDSVKAQTPHTKKKDFDDVATKRALHRTGVLTAIAIAIHNIPEGVTTYTGAMKNPKLGVALAIAVALHNIPEGIAVATPVYFATRSKFKAFLWTLLSALAEPLGGVIGWLIAGDGLNPNVNGTLFGLVVGMMVTISVKELIPTAYHFCPSRDKVNFSILIGMCIMAVSLILLDYAGV